MKYLSIDIEALGVAEKDQIIEFAAIAFDANTHAFNEELTFHSYIECPPFEVIRNNLNDWVASNMKSTITAANLRWVPLWRLKEQLREFLNSPKLKEYFWEDKIILFGKSMQWIDMPFLIRDLWFDFVKHYFSHRSLDLTSFVLWLVDMWTLPPECVSGSWLMKYLWMWEVAHTALEDAKNTAEMYFKIISKFNWNN